MLIDVEAPGTPTTNTAQAVAFDPAGSAVVAWSLLTTGQRLVHDLKVVTTDRT